MYGHTLNGLIKNGIRLSYSKNPLGVRSPSLSNGSSGVSSYTSAYHSAHESSGGGRFAPKTSSVSGEGRPRQEVVAEGPPPRHTANVSNNFVANYGFDLTRGRHFSTSSEYTVGLISDHRVVSSFGDATSPPPRFFAPNSAPPNLTSPPLSQGAPSTFGSVGSGKYTGGSTFSPFGNDLPMASSTTTGNAAGTGTTSSIASSFIDRNDPIVPPPGSIHNIPSQLHPHPHPSLNHQVHHPLFNHHSQQQQHPLLDRYDGPSNSLYNIPPGPGDSRVPR